MSARDVSGPAFPCEGGDLSGLVAHPGMTLRDYFAAKAMAALITNQAYGGEIKRIFDPQGTVANKGDDRETPQTYVCRLAIEFADAVIESLNQSATK